MVSRICVAAALLFAVGSSSVIHAQDDSWYGQTVICKKSAHLVRLRDRVNGKDVEFSHSGSSTNEVRGDNGSQLRIYDGHREGWVDKADFVLVREAPMFFHRRVQANPKDAFAIYMRGVAWFHSGEPEHAAVDFTKCIKIDPKDEKSFNYRGNAWRLAKEFDKAVDDYGEAILLNPKVVYPFFNRGIAYSAKREPEKAIRDFGDAIALDPKRARLYLFRGAAHHSKRDLGEAIKDYDECLRLDPRGAFAGILAYFAAKQKGDDAAAKRYLHGPPSEFGEAWPFPIVQFLRRDIDEPTLLALANDNDRLTEVCCFLGLDHLLKGRNEDALAQFAWVKNFGNADYVEYGVAAGEHDRLKKQPDR